MVTDNQLNQITQLLKLEKITVVQKMILIAFPTEINDDFNNKFNDVKTKLRKISPFIDIIVCSDCEIEEIKQIGDNNGKTV